MSYEAWGDDSDINDGYVTDERCREIAEAAFQRGVQACREMMARFVEQGGDARTAQSIRLNWNPSWGDDPGAPSADDYEKLGGEFDPWDWAP